jgi:hypothetical protein
MHSNEEKLLFASSVKKKAMVDHIVPIEKKSNSLAQLFLSPDLTNISFDKILGFKSFLKWDRNNFSHDLLKIIKKGKIVLFEYIPSLVQRPLAYLEDQKISCEQMSIWKNAEDQIFSDAKDEQLNWNENTIFKMFENQVGCSIQVQIIPHHEKVVFNKTLIARLFQNSENDKISYGERMRKYLSDKDYQVLKNLFEEKVGGVTTTWLSTYALFTIDVDVP